MKCTSCSGRLQGTMTFCPFCGVRQDVNLRQIHFRDLGTDESLPCPHCSTALDVIEFDTEPKIRIERCTTCFGTFFNPGELESLLDAQTNPLVWLDPTQLNQIAIDFAHEREIVYLKCPMCAERMSHLNFGGHSGVIVDRCGTHGVWLEGSELRRLTEWWRAGGKLIYQQHEAARAKRLYGSVPTKRIASSLVTTESPPHDREDDSGKVSTFDVLAILGGLLSIFVD
ncbi:zf-TFIIB domain-containing protein [Luteolibacter flavescens]|uniref:Zf-TFIIB domain-containing protein n=1 Tax=Luteolibacter flavescens TaxID=1859460 RepID=A0ABT3FIF4_9BACT|nr:zf-TFIIB domain-containing protein [Luteolibacter flavescens]MCW1883348.1 zf-TFIIB domain-containing protein [Luteolibacter flavescens]